MKQRIGLLCIFSVGLALHVFALGGNATGVVVEAVSPDSEASHAGLQPGDLLQSWTREDAKGEIESPFDIWLIEIEQASRAPVTLQGSRAGTQQTWTLGAGHWSLTTRPNLPLNVLATYQEGQELAQAGKLADAAERWQKASSQLDATAPLWLRVWFQYRAANTFAKSRQWKDADAIYERVMQQAKEVRPEIRVYLLWARARTYQLRADWKSTEKCFQEAFKEREKISDLLFADVLDGLGSAALQMGQLEDAEKYYSQAMQIQEKLTPNSLRFTVSILGVAAAAKIHGNLTKAEEYDKRALLIQQQLVPESQDVAESFNSLGNVASAMGQFETAENYYKQALAIDEKLTPNSTLVARILANLGRVLGTAGDLAQSEKYLQQAFAL